MPPILTISDVHQKFRTGFWLKSAHILKGVSLEVASGSVFGFIGPNGAGKTTLIHLIVGLRKPASGSLKLEGMDTTEPRARLRIGYLPERPYFHEHLTGSAFLRYFGALSGIRGADLSRRISEALEIVGMGHAQGKELKTYSKGMLQRIGIAQAILHDPDVLVFDEPMSGLDPIGRKEVRELIIGLASRGKTIFFSTHVIPDVEAICDQVALIEQGKIIGYGPIENFLMRRSAKTEIGFGGITLEQVNSLRLFESVRQTADGFRALVTHVQGDSEIDEALSRLLALKARIHSVTSVHPSLESFFSAAQEKIT